MNAILRIGLCCAALFALPAQAATICVKKGDTSGRCEPTITDGIAAAAAGDTIVVKPATYFESVTVPLALNGLIIKGSGKTIIDPAATGMPALTIEAPNVTVTGLTINNVDDHGILVNDSGDGITITKVSVNHATGACLTLEVDVDNATLAGNKFFGCSTFGIDLAGDNGVVAKNKFNASEGPGIFLEGTLATIEGNLCTATGGCVSATLVEDNNNVIVRKNKASVQTGDAFRVFGDEALIEGNSGVGLAFRFVEVSGEDPQVLSNKSKEAGDGIEVRCATDCDGFLVERNSQTNLQGICIESDADADGAMILNNSCKQAGAGYELEGDATETLQGNKLVDGSSDAFIVDTPTTTAVKTLIKNKATYAAGDGFDIDGFGGTAVAHIIQGNKASKNAADGFNFSTTTNGVQVTGNTATGNVMEGFDNRGGATAPNVFNDNKASKNRQGSDFCNEGTTDSLTDNDFDTDSNDCVF